MRLRPEEIAAGERSGGESADRFRQVPREGQVFQPPPAPQTELCRRIRESDPHTPILFFSGVDPKLQREALSCGAQGFVLKPNFDDLWGEVSRALRQTARRSAGLRSRGH